MPSFNPRSAPAAGPKKSSRAKAAKRSRDVVVPLSFVGAIFLSSGGAFGKVVLALLVREQVTASKPGAPFEITIGEICRMTDLGTTAVQEAVHAIKEAGLIEYTPGRGPNPSQYRILRPASASASGVESFPKSVVSGRSKSLAPLRSCLTRLAPGMSSEERIEILRAFGKTGQAAAAAAALEELSQTDSFALELPTADLIERVKKQIASQPAKPAKVKPAARSRSW